MPIRTHCRFVAVWELSGGVPLRVCPSSKDSYGPEMPVVDIPLAEITDWETFHDTFSRALGFPGADRASSG
jgi:hypothetical protein